ncbi:PAS domain-containing sensor histidine kinase [Microbacterium fluvii]|uniref:histidine kinase n=1 Tax=Microbacterium fluvii TaxID=415215 RepID=A0ABW2HGV5_9MICO|nr:PAS domain-containing sensor histidine kinase [Microbacterium fluvii]MCU4672647.1 PAS domain-containing sensor histidine kinase [Microbacterium fluvii]
MGIQTQAPHGEAVPAPRWGDIVQGERGRARTAMLNQILICAVIMVVAIMVLAGGVALHIDLFFAAVVLIFVLTACTFLLPWHRLPAGALALIPLGDVVAFGLLRLSDPTAGFGLLFVFPVIWLATSFGLAGYIGGVAAALTAFGISSAIDPRQSSSFAFLLLPLLMIAVGTISYIGARRAAAQRLLLDRQAHMLTSSLERARRHEHVVTEALDGIDFGVARIERDGTTSLANDAHTRLQWATGAGGSEAEMFAADGTTPLDAEDYPLARARRGEAFDDARVRLGADPATARVLSVTCHRILDDDGADAGAIVVSRDVTAELEAMRERDALVATVSHELRTPLTSIMGYIELAADTPGLPEAAARHLQVADRNAEHLLELVGDVMAASSTAARSAELSIDPQEVDIAPIARAAVESILVSAGRRQIAIDTSRLTQAPVHADPRRLQQVLDNLLSNAVKYNRVGGRVSVATASDGIRTTVLVEDTGVGMTPEDLTGIFERFYRGAAVRRSDVSGTGLGLAISRDIVRRHGGDITVRSTVGVGTAFTVTLPAARPGTLEREGDA